MSQQRRFQIWGKARASRFLARSWHVASYATREGAERALPAKQDEMPGWDLSIIERPERRR